MPRFKVFDCYKWEHELLGEGLTMEEAISLIDQRIDDTDGECDCYYVREDEEQEIDYDWKS